MSNQAAAEAILDALGDPTRRRIVERLRHGPVAVGNLAAQLPVGRPAVSKHLRVLEGAGLVEHCSVGTRNLYALAPHGFVVLQQWLVQTWDQALTAFADRVRERAAEPSRGRAAEPSRGRPAQPSRGRAAEPSRGRPAAQRGHYDAAPAADPPPGGRPRRR
jgi:DNA-binding transcriptional ArsR family regulator